MVYYSKNGVVVRDAKAEDVKDLEGRLRAQDAREVLSAREGYADYSLADSFARSSMRYTIVIDGNVAGMFGLVPDSLLGKNACVWFLGGDGMSRIKKTFVRLSRIFISHFLDVYPELYNWVDIRYEESIKWLRSCGARFTEAASPGKTAPIFLKFIIRRA